MIRLLALAARPSSVERRGTLLVFDSVALVGNILIRPLGSSRPEFVPEATLKASAPKWVNRPVVPDHPLDSAGVPVPVRAASREVVGSIRASTFSCGKLVTTVGIDTTKARKLGGAAARTVADLEAGRMVEVSVGAHVQVSNAGRWLDIEPDHLAVGVDRGACSIELGCGAPRAACQHTNHNQEIVMNDQHPNAPDPYQIAELRAARECEDTEEARRAALLAAVSGKPEDPPDGYGLAGLEQARAGGGAR
jgi:hypothetical protein